MRGQAGTNWWWTAQLIQVLQIEAQRSSRKLSTSAWAIRQQQEIAPDDVNNLLHSIVPFTS